MAEVASAPNLSQLVNILPSQHEPEKHWNTLDMPKTDMQTPLETELRALTLTFLDEIGYNKPPRIENEALWTTMLEGARETGVDLTSPLSRRCFEVGFTYAAICYPTQPLEAQVFTGLHTWLGTLIDDIAMKDDVRQFQQRFHSGERQPTLILQAYANLLRSTYDEWDDVTANSIIISSLAFINCNVLEERPEFQSMVPTKGGRRWPHYFRDREGVPDAYSYFTFPKTTHPDIGLFLEAIPDMGRVLNLCNDVLSFYKEEKAGITKNYIHQRASYEGRDVISVLKDAAKECLEAQKRIELVLEGREPYRSAWLDHLHGYIHMHKTTKRYRLDEIGLGEEKSCEAPWDSMPMLVDFGTQSSDGLGGYYKLSEQPVMEAKTTLVSH